MIKFFFCTVTVVLAGSILAAQEKRTDPPCAQAVERRIEEGLTWIADNPWPTDGAGWRLRHAYLDAMKDPKRNQINKAVLDYCAG